MYRQSAPETIQAMFANIAPSYDTANFAMSFGLHKWWNRALLKEMGPLAHKELLDLCCGTGEIALPLLKKEATASATLLDFCPEMVEIARSKAKKWDIDDKRLCFLVADAEKLPLKKERFDGVTVAYGIRNIKKPENCIKEAYRVLKPGGTFGILELTRPKNKLLSLGHRFYLSTCLPVLGWLAAKDKKAYRYLSKSINSFASPKELDALMQGAGFQKTWQKSLLGGLATLIMGQK